MTVGMYYRNDDVRLEEVPIPEIGRGEVLIKTEFCGICGSDIMEWYRMKKAPLVLGHEVTGVVAKIGKGVRDYKEGDRVFVTHHVPCDNCRYCIRGQHSLCDTLGSTNFDPGGFAEYIRLPQINVKKGIYLLPDEISFEEGTFIEPLACVARGQRLIGLSQGDTVLVIGSGLSGLLHIQLARLKGAGKIVSTDIDSFRLSYAKDFGADFVISAREDVLGALCKVNDGRPADCIIIATSELSAIQQGLSSADKGARVLFFAPTEPGIMVPFHLFDLWNRQVTMKSTYAAVREDILEAIELLRKKRVDVMDMITDILPLKQIQKGFDLVTKGGKTLKVVIRPTSL